MDKIFDENVEIESETSDYLKLYREYCEEELIKGNDILTFSEFRDYMNN